MITVKELITWLDGQSEKWLVVEQNYSVQIYLPASVLPQSLIAWQIVDRMTPIGTTFTLHKLPWYKCWFKKRQWISFNVKKLY